MGRQGAAARRRARLGLAPVKPGKIGWVHGTKLTFFEGFKEQYLAAVELKETGPFYSRIAQKYLDKYGYNTPWEGDLEEGQDVADDVDLDEDVNSLTQEEGEERAEYYAKLRSKIGVWYNGQYGGSVEKKKANKVSFRTIFDKPELDPPQPVKTRTLHYYSHRFYEERIKPRLVAHWAAVQRLPNLPAIVTLWNKVTRECWEAESDEFKAEVLAAREAEHQLAMDAYSSAVSTETPTTPEEYSVALNNAGYYLQPFADSAHERFGMNVVILLCGPVPDRGGRIEVRSIHAGKSNGLVPRIWADYDRAGFDATQRSFIEFSHHCFSKSDILLDDWKLNMECDLAEADCRARGLNGMGTEGQDEAPASLSSNETPSSSSETPISTSANETPSSSSSSDSPTPPLSSSPQMPQWSQPESGSLPPLRPLRDSLRYDPLDPAFDGLISMDFGPEAGMGDGLHAGIGDNFNFDFGGGFGGLGSVFGDGGAEFFGPDPERNGGDNLPPLNLTNCEDDEEEALGDKSPSSSPAGDKSASSAPAASPSPARDAAPAVSSPPPGAAPAASSPSHAAAPAASPSPARSAARAASSSPAALAAVPVPRPKPKAVYRGARPPPPPAREDEPRAQEVAANRVWEEQETDSWPEELQTAFAGFARGKSWGGERWERCVLELVALERAWDFPGKGLLAVPNSAEDRPGEVERFMRYGRKWGSRMELASEIGPGTAKNSFAGQWWNWWGVVQPESRKNGDSEMRRADEVPREEWEEIGRMAGRNGVLLYVGALLWWGEAAAAAPEAEKLLEDWCLAVDDVAAVLGEARKAVEANGKKAAKEKAAPEKKAAATRASKRKRPDAPSSDKENEPLRKRTRSSRQVV
ncbi:hypothetical protein B0H13DRAFT_2382726 [Mycena leptocephala]|nr:hypothetical protein B0H13DRAFT_2382726 [Mycena leptocephala]